ncbi:MAG: hypothetical protein ACI4AX_01370, partial [Muribaculaceae bacterium]
FLFQKSKARHLLLFCLKQELKNRLHPPLSGHIAVCAWFKKLTRDQCSLVLLLMSIVIVSMCSVRPAAWPKLTAKL